MIAGDSFQTRTFAPGDLILIQDEKGNEAFIIKEGAVRVYLSREGRVVDLAELGPGQIIGEMSLLTDDVNAANVAAVSEVEVYVITAQALQQKISESDPLIRELIRMLIARVRSTDKALLKSETREFIEVDFL